MAAKKRNPVGRPLIDLAGQRFGKLVVIERASSGKHTTWLCACDCGIKKEIAASSIAQGSAQSCGCLRQSQGGMSSQYPKEYISWCRMIDRTTRPNCPLYAQYGAAGRCVCERWRDSFASFMEDMGPSNGLTLERINNSGGYTCGKCEQCRSTNQPANCRWATMLEQGSNKSNSRHLTHDGKTLIIAEWARILGVHGSLISRRLKRGWSIERALSVSPASK